MKRTGPMTMAASLGTGYLKTRPELETPDIQFHIQPFSADNPTEGTHRFDAFTASVLQMRPESAGELVLKSGNPNDHPDIHPNYLATQLDQDTIVEGIRIARHICRQRPVADVITEEHAPGTAIADDDYDALLNWARDTATTIYHPTGTCKMGPNSDKMAAVDERLRVKGVSNLRVADCSIMPMIVSGNTNAPAIMIGERMPTLSVRTLADEGKNFRFRPDHYRRSYPVRRQCADHRHGRVKTCSGIAQESHYVRHGHCRSVSYRLCDYRNESARHPGLLFVGACLLFWVCWRLYVDIRESIERRRP